MHDCVDTDIHMHGYTFQMSLSVLFRSNPLFVLCFSVLCLSVDGPTHFAAVWSVGYRVVFFFLGFKVFHSLLFCFAMPPVCCFSHARSARSACSFLPRLLGNVRLARGLSLWPASLLLALPDWPRRQQLRASRRGQIRSDPFVFWK